MAEMWRRLADMTTWAGVYRTDKGQHGYLPYYNAHLPEEINTLVEIGIAGGASLQLWHKIFPTAEIIGIDNKITGTVEDGFTCVYGDGTTADAYKHIDLDRVSVVIDDGSHQSADIKKALELLWPDLPSGCWYVIEDLATQFDPNCGGNQYGSPATSAIYDKLLDTIRTTARDVSEFHAYEEIVFIRKL